MDLTDDMAAILKAAYRVAPNGEVFILGHGTAPGPTARSRCHAMAATNTLNVGPRWTRKWMGFPTLRAMEPPPYTLSKLGRPVAKQLVADEKRARWRRINAALVWIAITVLAGLFTLGFNVLDRRIQRWEQNAATSQQSN